MLHDVRLALRSLAERPGFATVALAMLALGIGVNAAVFSLVHAVLLRPLPFPDAERLVKITGERAEEDRYSNISVPDFEDFQRQSQMFAGMGAMSSTGRSTLTGIGTPERLRTARVSAGFFSALGVSMQLGRSFTRDEDRPGAPRVAILTDGIWRSQFGSDPAIVGREIRLGGNPTVVVGVLPGEFRHPEIDADGPPAIFVPLVFDPATMVRSGRFIRAIARLKPNVPLTEAQAELSGIAAQLERAYPVDNRGYGVVLTPLLDSMVGPTRPALMVLVGAVAVVLLIACVNIANLLLASGATRRRELAVRTALGATWLRLARQLITESFVLACLGGLLGLLVAHWSVRSLLVLGADSLPRLESIGVDWRVLGFTLGLSVLTTMCFGLAPALWLSRAETLPELRVGGTGGTTGPGTAWFRRGLVAGEVALSMALLIVAGLLIKSFWRLSQVDPGFQSEHVLAVEVSVPISIYPEGEQIPFHRELSARIAALPEVRAVGAVNILPLVGDYSCDAFQVDARPVPEGEEPCAEARSVTPDYFRAMGVRLLRGRFFTAHDTEASPRIVIVNEAMARQYWPGEDPIGMNLTYVSRGQGDSREIVGVVGNIRHFGLDRDEAPEFYTPHAQQPSYHSMTFIVRSDSEPTRLTAPIRQAVSSLDGDVPISNVRTLEQIVASSIAQPRLRTVLVGAFSTLAIVLALGGLYGVIAYAVSQRTREIGIRMALGAQGRQMLMLMMREGMLPLVAGIGLGLGGAFLVGRLVTSLLFGVTTTDVTTFALLPLALAGTALVATYLPARRATLVDPIVALRSE